MHTRIETDNDAPQYNVGEFIDRNTIDVYPLDRICSDLPIKIDFIKIDTEGYEVKVIQGGLVSINEYKPKLLIEIHHRPNEEKIRELLPEYTFTVIHHPEHEVEGPYWWAHYWIVGTRDNSPA